MKREAKNFPEAAHEAVMLEATDAEYLTVNRIAITAYYDVFDRERSEFYEGDNTMVKR